MNNDVMSSSCIGLVTRTRKHSWADDLEDEPSLTQGSHTLQKIVSLARRTGTDKLSTDFFSQTRRLFFDFNTIPLAGVSLDGLDDIDAEWDSLVDDGFSEETEITTAAQYAKDLRINNAIREIFLNRFVHIFASYEQFIIQPNQVSVGGIRGLISYVQSSILVGWKEEEMEGESKDLVLEEKNEN